MMAEDAPTFIPVAKWLSFAIHPQGSDIEIAFDDASGRQYILKLAPPDVGILFSNIPRMIEVALQRQSGDAELNHVFALADWKIAEVNEGDFTMMTLIAPDGFKVSFATPSSNAKQLGQAILQGCGGEVQANVEPLARH
jgi:hypothetical protein